MALTCANEIPIVLKDSRYLHRISPFGADSFLFSTEFRSKPIIGFFLGEKNLSWCRSIFRKKRTKAPQEES